MCEFPGWYGTQAALINTLLYFQRNYIHPDDDKPIKYIMGIDFEFMLEQRHDAIMDKMEKYKRNGYPIDSILENARRYEYLKNHIDIWTKAINILINNYIVKYKLREKDYPEENCNINDLSYSEYLKTDRWTLIKNAAMIRDWHRCVLCWSEDKLCWHHRSYSHKWKWDYKYELQDVYILCERCHKMFHDNVNIKELW